MISISINSFFLGKIYFANNDGLQSMFVYQPTFSMIKFWDTNTVISWESKGLHVTDLVPMKNDSLPKIKYFKHEIGILFNYTPLVAGQINCKTKIVNVYIVYDLDNWPKNPLRNFTLKNCLEWLIK